MVQPDEHAILCTSNFSAISQFGSDYFDISGSFFSQEGATHYRHLAAILRHCMLLSCETQDRTEELQR